MRERNAPFTRAGVVAERNAHRVGGGAAIDVEKELAGVGIGRLLHFRASAFGGRDRNTFGGKQLEGNRGGFVVPVDSVDGIEIEAEVEFALALANELWLGFGAEFHIKRIFCFGQLRFTAQTAIALFQPDAGHNASGGVLGGRRGFHVQFGDEGYLFDLADMHFEIFTESIGIAPGAAGDDFAFGVDQEFGIGRIGEQMLQRVLHGVAEPGDFGAERALRFLDMEEALLKSDRADVTVQIGMSKRFVKIVELHSFGGVIFVNGLQTGDLIAEGRSSETAADKHRPAAFEGSGLERLAFGIVDGGSGEERADSGGCLFKLTHDVVGCGTGCPGAWSLRQQQRRCGDEQPCGVHKGPPCYRPA